MRRGRTDAAQRQNHLAGRHRRSGRAAQPATRRARRSRSVLRGDRETLLSAWAAPRRGDRRRGRPAAAAAARAARAACGAGARRQRPALPCTTTRSGVSSRAKARAASRPASRRWVIASTVAMAGADEHAPTMRELAIAVSHVGLDPRSLRRPAGQEAIDGLWQGTTVAGRGIPRRSQAPDLDLGQVIAVLGPRAPRLCRAVGHVGPSAAAAADAGLARSGCFRQQRSRRRPCRCAGRRPAAHRAASLRASRAGAAGWRAALQRSDLDVDRVGSVDPHVGRSVKKR